LPIYQPVHRGVKDPLIDLLGQPMPPIERLSRDGYLPAQDCLWMFMNVDLLDVPTQVLLNKGFGLKIQRQKSNRSDLNSVYFLEGSGMMRKSRKMGK